MGNRWGLFKERPPPPPSPPPPPPPPPQIVAPKVVEEPPAVIRRRARESMGIDCINYYNFAVCGLTGVGKSSLINALLSLKGEAASPVGEIETTQDIRWYTNKKWPYLRIWDIPGAGTTGHPASTYFQDKKLCVFDAILILTSDRFLEVDFKVMESALKYGIPCAFVRTKCDVAVNNRAKRDKVNAFEASRRLREDVTRSFRDGLQNAGLLGSPYVPKLFFISNEYDYSSEDEEQDAYSFYDPKDKSIDTSLPCMDEPSFLAYILEAVERRAQTNKSSK